MYDCGFFMEAIKSWIRGIRTRQYTCTYSAAGLTQQEYNVAATGFCHNSK